VSVFLGYLAIGVSAGLVYALLAMGIVLIYKGSRILNLAHPYFGLLAVFSCWWMTSKASFAPFSSLPFRHDTRPRLVVAAALSLLLVALNAFAVERGIIRRLRNVPRLVTLVATIALAEGTLGLVHLLFGRTQRQTEQFRHLPSLLHSHFSIGSRVVTGDDITVLIATAAIALAGYLFFTRTKFGVAVRAAAENADAARLVGISADRVSMFVWVTGLVLAGVAGILISQVSGGLDESLLGLGFLVRGLTAALIGGLTSLPGAVVGGLAVGVSESLIHWKTSTAGLADTALFVVIIAVLLFRPGGLFSRPEQTEDKVALVPTLKELPARLRRSTAARGVQMIGWAVVVVVCLSSLVTGSATNGILVRVVAYAMVGVSLTVLMGYTGQISLGHWGLAGVGAFSLADLYGRLHVPYLLAVPLTILIGMAVSLVIGLPALRIRGLYLAVVTLAFNVAAELYLFRSNLIAGASAGVVFRPPKLGPLDLGAPSHRPLFVFSLIVLALCLLVARNLARSRTGRGFFSLRENEKAAATFGVSATRYKLAAFVVSGGVAALAGVVYATYRGIAQSSDWGTGESILLITMVMIGGLGSLSGSILGAFLVVGLPRLVHLDNPWIVPIGTGILLIVVIVRARGGLAGLVYRVREWLVRSLDQMAQPATPNPP
jgi:ABC-type branched-subunit amino acid transport system permease subunit